MSSVSDVSSDATVRGLGAAGFLVDKRIMFLVLAVVLVGAWGYARFGGSTSSPLLPLAPIVGTFPAPVAFVANPRFNLVHVHVRSGPGPRFRILETISRGDPLTGVARTADTTGAFWIVLANERGYVKESVLRPANRLVP